MDAVEAETVRSFVMGGLMTSWSLVTSAVSFTVGYMMATGQPWWRRKERRR